MTAEMPHFTASGLRVPRRAGRLRRLPLCNTSFPVSCIAAPHAFAQGLIKGKLDQRRRCLEVHWAAARDMKPGQLERMQATLAQWCALL
jgi:hypothetical protein